MTSVAETLRRKLVEALAPEELTIIDESHRHAGHSGDRPEGETHFHVEIVAAAFAGKSRLEQQRLVHQALAEELASRVHALSLTTRAPNSPTG